MIINYGVNDEDVMKYNNEDRPNPLCITVLR